MKTKLLKKSFLTLFTVSCLALSSLSMNAQHSIVFTDPLPPTTIAEGATVTVTFKYITATAGDKYQARLVRKTSGTWAEDKIVPELNVQDLSITPVDGTTATATFTLPNDVLTTLPLGAAQDYRFIVSIFDSAWGNYVGTEQAVTITPILATASFNKADSKLLTQNPVGDRLLINSNVDFKFATIYDMSGKKVIKITKASESTDVSSLKKGVYVIVTDTGIKTKFVKK